MLRPPDRRLGLADDLRDLPAAPGPRRAAPAAQRGRARAGAQPRRIPPPERLLDRDRGPPRRVSAYDPFLVASAPLFVVRVTDFGPDRDLCKESPCFCSSAQSKLLVPGCIEQGIDVHAA